jgi:hypothetical protein
LKLGVIMPTVRLHLDDDDRLRNWLHSEPKKKPAKKKLGETKESMEPFKPTDGDLIQKPRVETVPEHNAHPRGSGKRMNPSGYGASKKERI